VLLEGGDDEKDPVVRVEGLGEQILGLLGRVVHVQVLLEKKNFVISSTIFVIYLRSIFAIYLRS
jgi:hypothetical protein